MTSLSIIPEYHTYLLYRSAALAALARKTAIAIIMYLCDMLSELLGQFQSVFGRRIQTYSPKQRAPSM